LAQLHFKQQILTTGAVDGCRTSENKHRGNYHKQTTGEDINIFSNEPHDIIHEEFSDISKKFHFLGFEAIETKKLPFNILAKKDSEIVLTKVGDKIHKDINSFSKLLEVNDFVIFNNKKPKNIPSLKKEKFLNLEDSEELIEIINEDS